jgi:hypothetical protein
MLSVTAAASGATDHMWSIGELVEAALTGAMRKPLGRKIGRITAIKGGLRQATPKGWPPGRPSCTNSMRFGRDQNVIQTPFL